MSVLVKILTNFFRKIFDRFIYNSYHKPIQRLRLIEKKVNILYQSNLDFNSDKFTKISRHLISAGQEKNVIRMGSENDGGYVLVNKSLKDSLLISMGIGLNLDFEEDWIKRGGKVVAFDGTITKVNSKMLSESTNIFKWIKQNINLIGDKESISINQGIHNALEAFKIDSKGTTLVLKMDIENSEWNALQEISEQNLSRFDQIIVEFHDLIKLTLIDFVKVNEVLGKLHNKFDLVWKHENNFSPDFIHHNTRFFDVVETTWHNKKSAVDSLAVPESDFFKGLNSPNDPTYPNY